ncbi:MAG TPA: HNH endonuclease signature motif containing protein, partial [Glycomyces sp.]|nr:HNH endonuclease signature motif containing protein [Glycomyces sp.]
HTATLDLIVDIETLQGKDTGRLPLLEGQPTSVARARLLACEAGVIPSVFNYRSGEAVELGRAMRLPNTALRRKLELEQPEGCAWSGCGRPVAWTEAHHLQHWADGGATTAENLILLCRFHHGRIHTGGWSVEKTGPGQAVITHHEGHGTTETQSGQHCGCSDYRTDADLDAENQGSDWDVFPTGLYRSEWSEAMKPDLDGHAEMVDRHRCLKTLKAAKAKARERFRTSEPPRQAMASTAVGSGTEPAQVSIGPLAPVGQVGYGDIPYLGGPFRWRPGRGRKKRRQAPNGGC